ncbi:MAG: hypothetical protein ACK46Z_02185 [Bacteroidota bacterium]
MPPSIADHRVSERQHPSNTFLLVSDRQHPSNTFPLVSKRQHPSIFDTRVSIDPILTSVSEPIRRK